MNIDFGRSFEPGAGGGDVVLTPETAHERQLMMAFLRLIRRGLHPRNVPTARVRIGEDLSIGIAFEYDLPQSRLALEDRLPAPPKTLGERAIGLIDDLLVMAADTYFSKRQMLDRAEMEMMAPPGHVIDDRGVMREVVGELPVTADGCVIGRSCRVFSASQSGVTWKTVRLTHNDGIELWSPSSVFASEAAAKKEAERRQARESEEARSTR